MASCAPATLLATLRPASTDSQAAPVSRVLYVQPSGSSEQPAVLALGGHTVGAPAELWAFTSLQVAQQQWPPDPPAWFLGCIPCPGPEWALVPAMPAVYSMTVSCRASQSGGNGTSSSGLQPLQDSPAEESVQRLPSFGAIQGIAAVPPVSDPQGRQTESVLVLSEGAQLMAHDAATWQPVPLSLPWQGLEPPLCTLSCSDGGLVSSGALAVRLTESEVQGSPGSPAASSKACMGSVSVGGMASAGRTCPSLLGRHLWCWGV